MRISLTNSARIGKLPLAVLLYVGLALASTAVRAQAPGLIVDSAVLPATGTGANNLFRVDFTQPFAAGVTPVVIVMPPNGCGPAGVSQTLPTTGCEPMSIRICDVDSTGFSAIQVEPPQGATGARECDDFGGCDGAHAAVAMSYMAAVPGTYELGDGTRIEAGMTSTQTVQHRIANGPTTGWDEVEFDSDFTTSLGTTPPTLLATVQTINNQPGSIGSCPSSITGTSSPFITAANQSVNADGLELAIELNEVNDNVPSAGLASPETVGWIAFPRNVRSTLDDGNGNAVGWGTASPANNIGGFMADSAANTNNQCYTNTLTAVPGDAPNPLGFGNNRSRAGNNGGWLRRCSLTATAAGANNNFQVGFYVDEDQDRDTERQHQGTEGADIVVFGGPIVTTPVTLAYLSSTHSSKGWQVQWVTETESSNVGFELEGFANGQWTQLATVASYVTSAMGPQTYEVELKANLAVERLRLVDLDLRGRRQVHGPFDLDKTYGHRPAPEPMLWAEVAEEVQHLRRKGQVQRARLAVSQAGIVRVSHQELVDAGVDFSGRPVESLQVLDEGVPQPRFVGPGSLFGPGSFIEFVAQAPATNLYGDENYFVLSADHGSSALVNNEPLGFDFDAAPVTQEYQFTVAEDHHYSFAAPGTDPWFDAQLLSYGAPAQTTRQIEVPDALTGGPGQLAVNLWGGTDWPGNGSDHHVIVTADGVSTSRRFDGVVERQIITQIGTVNATNAVDIEVPGDTGFNFDIVNIESVSLTLTGPSRAVQDRWSSNLTAALKSANDALFASSFEAGGVKVSGFSDDEVILWTGQGSNAVRYNASAASQADGFAIALPLSLDLSAQPALAATPDAMATARIMPHAPDGATALSGVDYLIVTHPLFEAHLADLIQRQNNRGLSVGVVTTEEIYAAYSDHQPSGEAIAAYIAAVASQSPLHYVVLVGSDTYDYKNHLKLDAISYVPTLYQPTSDLIRYTPVDALLGDTNQDGVPDLALGRLPVRSVAELNALLNKQASVGNTLEARSLFVADQSDVGQVFASQSRSMSLSLGSNWQREEAFADEIGVPATRSALLDGFASQPGLMSFVGHSSFDRWSFDALLNTGDVSSLSGGSMAGIVAQWGCWNSYFVAPDFTTLGGRLLLEPDRGAAHVIGAATLINSYNQAELGAAFYAQLRKPEQTLGGALLSAQKILAANRPEARDAYLGMVLLGDPAQPLPSGNP